MHLHHTTYPLSLYLCMVLELENVIVGVLHMFENVIIRVFYMLENVIIGVLYMLENVIRTIVVQY